MSVYISTSAVDAAMTALMAHTRGTPSGTCAACGQPEPCPDRGRAHAVLWQCGGALPRRIPGHCGAHWRPAVWPAPLHGGKLGI